MLKEMYYFKEDGKAFADNLKKLIKTRNLTAQKVSNQLGDFYYEKLKKWKTGERLPSMDEIHKLSEILNVSMEELYLPNAQLHIDENEYTKLFTNSDPNKLDIFYNFFPNTKEDAALISKIEFEKQASFKEELNYLVQKKLFSYLTDTENQKLKFYFENVLKARSYKDDGKFPYTKVDYERFWNEIDCEMIEKRGKAYKYKITIEEMKEYYFEFKKKLEFVYDTYPQLWQIEKMLDFINDADILKTYFSQFDEVIINCAYTSPKLDKRAKRVLKKLGAKKIDIKIDDTFDSTYDIYEEVKSLSYKEYLFAIGEGN